MRIVQLTNTYLPHVGGVARSVESFGREYRRLGHRVLVVAPAFEGAPERETDVVRMPAIVRFNGSDFSVPVPVPGRVASALDRFRPEIVHSHHPFLLGDTALRVAAARDLPVVFTHHTLYERYTHYVPGDSPAMKRFVVDLVVGYSNLCDAVIAPSESIGELLLRRGVTAPVAVIPTGIEVERFASGDGGRFRRAEGIREDAFVVGHTGRLAPEKNLPLLARAVGRFLAAEPAARFLVVGAGPSAARVRSELAELGVADRLHMPGVLTGTRLADAYRAMDVFVFASRTETQGMVLVEAMAAGVPVVALDAPGVREVVRDGIDGRLLGSGDGGDGDDAGGCPRDEEALAAGLAWVAGLDAAGRRRLADGVAETSRRLSLQRTARSALDLYRALLDGRREAPRRRARSLEHSAWAKARRRLGEEWRIFRNIASAVGETVLRPGEGP